MIQGDDDDDEDGLSDDEPERDLEGTF